MSGIASNKTIRLGSLVAGYADAGNAASTEINDIALDSRDVKEGTLFCAYRGHRTHGLDYIENAIENGATAVIYDVSVHDDYHQELIERYRHKLPLIKVNYLHKHVGDIASRFFGEPSKYLKILAVTGTDGKTSVTQFIAQALSNRYQCGVIGTLGCGVYGKLDDINGRTTPDPVTLQRNLQKMRDQGVEIVVMEASSHGLDQNRLAGTSIDVAIFTNISHDHLDYHGSFKRYAESKHKLFTWPKLKTAILNFDNEYGREWANTIPDGCHLIGYSTESDYHAATSKVLRCNDLIIDDTGIEFDICSPFGSTHLVTSLLGRFNASNLLAALGGIVALGIEFADAVNWLSKVTTVPGRMEAIPSVHNQPLVVVDYAHTPEAVSHVLSALREHCTGTLWIVFGCGGDRDELKRPIMGRNAEELADVVIVTNDNPRSECPISIIEDITSGMIDPDSAYVIPDRSEAIARALYVASKDDVVLIAGKGHENEQCIGNVCMPFYDIEQAKQLLMQGVANG